MNNVELAGVPDLVLDSKGSTRQYWRDIWEYREPFYFLAWRDILIRYKQTIIGIGWAVIHGGNGS